MLVNAKSKKHYGRTNGRTDEVTLSLLELLIAAKNVGKGTQPSDQWDQQLSALPKSVATRT